MFNYTYLLRWERALGMDIEEPFYDPAEEVPAAENSTSGQRARRGATRFTAADAAVCAAAPSPATLADAADTVACRSISSAIRTALGVPPFWRRRRRSQRSGRRSRPSTPASPESCSPAEARRGRPRGAGRGHHGTSRRRRRRTGRTSPVQAGSMPRERLDRTQTGRTKELSRRPPR